MKLPSSHCFIETINLIETINFINIAIYHSCLLFLCHRTLLSLSLCLPLLPRLESRSNITFSVLTLSSLCPSSSNTCLHNPPSSKKKKQNSSKSEAWTCGNDAVSPTSCWPSRSPIVSSSRAAGEPRPLHLLRVVLRLLAPDFRLVGARFMCSGTLVFIDSCFHAPPSPSLKIFHGEIHWVMAFDLLFRCR